jgi:ribonuclease HI
VSGRREHLCYTDGSCKAGDDAPGGWGFCIKPPTGDAIEGYGSATRTLAKVMEYRAVAEALGALPNDVAAIVFSDNQSLVENLAKRLDDWRRGAFAKVDPHIVETLCQIVDPGELPVTDGTTIETATANAAASSAPSPS